MTLHARVMSYMHGLKKVSLHEIEEGPLAVSILQVSWGQAVIRKVVTLRDSTETLRRT